MPTTLIDCASYGGTDEDLYATDEDIAAYCGNSSIGFDPEYLLRELLYLLLID